VSECAALSVQQTSGRLQAVYVRGKVVLRVRLYCVRKYPNHYRHYIAKNCVTCTCNFFYLLNFLLELFIMKYVKTNNICSYCFITVCSVPLLLLKYCICKFAASENEIYWTSSELC
jgi:hypothetical protein